MVICGNVAFSIVACGGRRLWWTPPVVDAACGGRHVWWTSPLVDVACG